MTTARADRLYDAILRVIQWSLVALAAAAVAYSVARIVL